MKMQDAALLIVGGAGLLLLCSILQVEAVSVLSYQPRNGPASGGTLITVTGEGFVTTGTGRSKCNFLKMDRRASAFSASNRIHNSTHISCTLPGVEFFFSSSSLPPEGTFISLAITAGGRQSNDVDFLVYDLSSSLITSITPNQDLTNSTNGTHVTITGQGFINTGEITCWLNLQNTTLSSAVHVSWSRLECVLPLVRVPSRINVTVSLNGQLVAAIPSLTDVRMVTFYSPAPQITSGYFSPSYSEILVHFDREVEIGPQEISDAVPEVPSDDTANLRVRCSQVFGSEALQLLGGMVSCIWQNTQQRVIEVRLTQESSIRDDTVLVINHRSIRTRHVLFSRWASGSVAITSQPGQHLTPLAIPEAPLDIPMCGEFVISGEKSLYSGTRGLEYEWTIGMELDELGVDILNPLMGEYIPNGFTNQSRLSIPSFVFYSNLTAELASGSGSSGSGSGSRLLPIVTYYVQLVARSYLGLSSTAVLYDITTTRSSSPSIVIVGERRRMVQPWSQTLLEGKVLRATNDCMIESRISTYSWRISGGALGKGLQGVKTNTSVLILPPGTLLPGISYRATLTVIFINWQSSLAYVDLDSVEGVEARLVGGVRRSLGSNESIDLDGTVSMIHLDPSTQLSVAWNCSTISVPELSATTSSCATFTGFDRLSLSLPGGSLMPGGYEFTMILSLTRNDNETTAQSSVTQLLVIFPHPTPPRIKITAVDLNPFLVHRKLFIEAEITSLNPGTVQWSTQYVIGYGQLLLQSNISNTPLQYSICSSLRSCPFTETSSNLYVAGVSIEPPQDSPLVNKISLVLQEDTLLPGNSYRFKLAMTDSFGQSGFAEVDAHTESVPTAGRVEIRPQNGWPLSTIFSLRALDWTEERGEGPLTYRLGFQYRCLDRSRRACEEWMTGISQDNEFSFTLPSIDSELDPALVVQVFDRNGAVQESIHNFSHLVISGNSEEPPATSIMGLLNLMDSINSTIVGGYWIQGLGQLSSLVTSISMAHESIICSGSRAPLSPKFQLSNSEFENLKSRALQIVLFLYETFIPSSQSHHQIILALLDKISRVQCGVEPRNNSSPFDQLDVQRMLNLLEEVVNAASNFSEYGVLSRRGISREDAQSILSTYEQVLYASTSAENDVDPIPRVNHVEIASSFKRVLPEIGYALCQRHKVFQESTRINLDGFLNTKSSQINLPPDYTAGGCSNDDCMFEPVMVDFGSELFSRFLQHPCSSEGSSKGARCCSGVCVSLTQLYLNLLWQGSEFSSLIKTPILHLSLLHPSNGTPVASPGPNTHPALTFPLVSQYFSAANLSCVVWDEESLSWTSSYCGTEVLQSSSRVRCRCPTIGSLFYAVLERCLDGYYGETCNQTCPQGLWGVECRMPCDCSDRGMCSPVDGSCDCDPGWEGTNCQNACVEGSYGKLCGETCRCQNGATCHHVTGECTCTPGWIGNLCNISCSEGFYGDECANRCQCRNASECHFTTGSCTCQAGFSGSTCHDPCPDDSYGLGCALACPCFSTGTRSCDPISGSCDCNEEWMGELCDEPPPEPTAPPFQIWWAVVAVLAAVLAAGLIFTLLVLVVIWRKKKKVYPISTEIDGKQENKDNGSSSSSSSNSTLDKFLISRTKSEDLLVPKGMDLKDVFLSSSTISETGTAAEFKEPVQMDGKLRWQIIRILSEGGSEGRKSSSLADRMILESRDSSRPTSKAVRADVGGDSPEKAKDSLSHDQTEMVYKRGVYLVPDATLKDLRNQFVDSEQLEEKNGIHFQFLNSDVPGDRIELDTEDEVLLCQIEDRLLQRRTMYIEHIDPGLTMCELCVCGKFADLECTSCRKRGYCGRECQERDWSNHEEFCREVSSRRERRRRRRQSRSRSGRRSLSREATPMSEETCVCGRDAEYECSGCNKQGYCSEECQREDWSFHEYYCNKPGNSFTTRLPSRTPSNMQRGKLQTLFELPESSIEEQ